MSKTFSLSFFKRGPETSMCCCLLCGPQPRTWPTTQACALTGNQTCNPLILRPAFNALSHTSQGHIYIIFYMKHIKKLLPWKVISKSITNSGRVLKGIWKNKLLKTLYQLEH